MSRVLPLPTADTKLRSVTVLGATGTIGQNTLNIIEAHPGRFRIEALTAGDNVERLAAQAKQFHARRAVIANSALYNQLKTLLAGTGIETAAGEQAVVEAAAAPCDIVMSAIVGSAGLKPTLAAIRRGATIALANKECLICAGELMNSEVLKYNATLIPVDSEHNAIFQLVQNFPPPAGGRLGGGRITNHLPGMPPPQPSPYGGGSFEWVERVTITASGGPFREYSLGQMKHVTPEQAIKHPNWNMGAKISVDSATLMNKSLELIEAFYLFPFKAEQLGVLIHPQSIVHCLVAMKDGSVLAQMSHPDMRTPIAYALAWPERIDTSVKKLNLAEVGSLTFEAPDEARFPALRLARSVLAARGNAPTVLSAANETAVERFLKNEIGFLDIAKTVEKTLETMDNEPLESIDDVLACDKEARKIAESL